MYSNISINATTSCRCDECEKRVNLRQMWVCHTCAWRTRRALGHDMIKTILCPKCALSHRRHWMKLIDVQGVDPFEIDVNKIVEGHWTDFEQPIS
ncbi:unnamed protein product, partial [Mesorhabditis belari]|uniref:Uncharacterized protein n=1 Tax=Mesorhabditis belari TaxID=2138241 RepID=A0AAF3EAA8_9BILA